jgi:hypothetical protein
MPHIAHDIALSIILILGFGFYKLYKLFEPIFFFIILIVLLSVVFLAFYSIVFVFSSIYAGVFH